MGAMDVSRKAARTRPPPISWLMRKALETPGLLSLAAGFVDPSSLPAGAVSSAAADALFGPEGALALQYGTTAGHAPLRRLIRDRIAAADGVAPEALASDLDQIAITSGSQQLLYLLCETLLDPGDIVLVADPTYFVFLGCLESAGARAVGVAADEEGMRPDALAAGLEILRREGLLPRVKAVYVVSYFDNPTGSSLSRGRRPALLEAVRRFDEGRTIHLIEDAAYRELRYEGEDLPSLKSLDPARVALAFTFSKSFSPGLRTGGGILPPALAARVLDLKGSHDFGSSHFNQVLIERALAAGAFDAHVSRLREVYREKRDAALAALEAGMPPGVSWIRPRGGLYVWVRFPEGVDTAPGGGLFEEALRRGVLYVPGAYCYAAEEGIPKPPNFIRLSFGVAPLADLREGIRRLGEAARAVAKIPDADSRKSPV